MGILQQQQQEISSVDGEISSAEDSVSIISPIIIRMILFENTNIKNEVQGPFLWSEIWEMLYISVFSIVKQKKQKSHHQKIEIKKACFVIFSEQMWLFTTNVSQPVCL